MCVHNVYDDSDSQAVRLINQILELVWGSLPARRRVEARHMVAKRAVVCVLLNRHQLNAVVSTLLDVGQNVVRKVSVRVYFALLRAHAHVTLINPQRANFLFWSLVLEFEDLAWVPEGSVKQVRVRVLD